MFHPNMVFSKIDHAKVRFKIEDTFHFHNEELSIKEFSEMVDDGIIALDTEVEVKSLTINKIEKYGWKPLDNAIQLISDDENAQLYKELEILKNKSSITPIIIGDLLKKISKKIVYTRKDYKKELSEKGYGRYVAEDYRKMLIVKWIDHRKDPMVSGDIDIGKSGIWQCIPEGVVQIFDFYNMAPNHTITLYEILVEIKRLYPSKPFELHISACTTYFDSPGYNQLSNQTYTTKQKIYLGENAGHIGFSKIVDEERRSKCPRNTGGGGLLKIKTKKKLKSKKNKSIKIYRSKYYYKNNMGEYKILWIHKYKRKDNTIKNYSKKKPGYCPWTTLPKYAYCIHYRTGKDIKKNYTGERYYKVNGNYILDNINRGYDDK